jgi:hypothetical protein
VKGWIWGIGSGGAMLVIGAWWLFRTVPNLVLGYPAAGGMQTSESWAVLLALWPVIVASGVVIGGLVAMALTWLVKAIIEQEANQQITEAQDQAKRAEQWAAQQIDQAEARFHAEAEETRQKQASAEAALREAGQAKAWAAAEVEKYQEEARQAHQRMVNAICAAERIKRRIEGKARLEVKKSH